MLDMAADMAVFFNPDEFGVVATCRLHGGGVVEVVGIYDEPAATIAPGGIASAGRSPVALGVADITTSAPAFLAPTARLLPVLPELDTITIEGRDYIVADKREDGSLTRLLLHIV